MTLPNRNTAKVVCKSSLPFIRCQGFTFFVRKETARYHMQAQRGYGMVVEVCEGAPVAVSDWVLTDRGVPQHI